MRWTMADQEPPDPDDAALFELAGAVADGKSIPLSALKDHTPPGLSGLQAILRIAQAVRQQFADDVSASLGDVLASTPSGPRPDLANAVRWGPLLLLENVGSGSFGQVYRAWDPTLDHEVALKRLHFPAGDRTRAAAVLREGQLLARVRHDNVITVHGALQAEDEVGIWMDFVRGRTLDRIVKDEGPMSAGEAGTIAECLCGALSAAHQAGVLHRDVKAANIMREAGGRIVLLDFGAGSEVTLSDAPGARRVVGTPLYMAPELFDGKPASPQSDIYSLGVLLFYLTTGSFPVPGKSVDEIRAAHGAGRRVLLPDLRADLPRRFVRVVERALAPDPLYRYPSSGAMLAELTASDARPTAVARPIRAVAMALTVAVGSLALLTFLGYITSGSYQLHMGLTSDFLAEGPTTLLGWGARNLVPTLFYIGLTVVSFYAVAAVTNLARRLPPLRVPSTSAVMWWQSWRRQTGLDDAETAAKTICAVGMIAFVAICVTFRDLLAGVMSRINDAPMTTLAVLNPSYLYTHGYFGIALDMLLLLMIVGLRSVWRAARTSSSRVPWGPVAGMAALALLAMALHAGGWRILFINQFRQVTIGDETCYLLGQNSSEQLVHCPDSAPPRNRVFKNSDPTVVPTNIIQNIGNAFVVH